jgi:hypothetical protein
MQSALAKAGFRWDVGGLQVAAPRPAGTASSAQLAASSQKDYFKDSSAANSWGQKNAQCKHNRRGVHAAGFRRVSLTIAAVSKAQEQPDNTEGDDEDEVTGLRGRKDGIMDLKEPAAPSMLKIWYLQFRNAW